MFPLAGRTFRLLKVGLVRAALPEQCMRLSGNIKPYASIVAVKNTAKLGSVEALGFSPSAIVVAGAVRRKWLLDNGIAKSWMFVEDGALPIQADDEITASEFMGMIDEAVCRKVRPLQCSSLGDWPYVREVFPFESYLTYQFKDKAYRLSFGLNTMAKEIMLSAQSIPVTADSILNKISISASMGDARESMPRVQTGVRYADAPPKANLQSFTTGAKNSELVTQIIRNFANINEAVEMWLDYCRAGNNKKQMKPAFQPVLLTDDNKVAAALAAVGVDAYEFARWASRVQADAAVKKTKSHSGEDVPMAKHAYVGNPKDPSTWHLPIDKPGRISNALARVNQTQGIPQSAKPRVISKIRRAAVSHGIDVSDTKTPKQKAWEKKGKMGAGAGGPLGRIPSAGVSSVPM